MPAELLRRSRLVYPHRTLESYHEMLLQDLKTSQELTAVALQKEQARQAMYYNRRNARRGVPFKINQLVWVYRPARGAKMTKLAHRWRGPGQVLEAAGYDNYRVKVLDTGRELITRCSFLLPYYYPTHLLQQMAKDIAVNLREEAVAPADIDSDKETDAEKSVGTTSEPGVAEGRARQSNQLRKIMRDLSPGRALAPGTALDRRIEDRIDTLLGGVEDSTSPWEAEVVPDSGGHEVPLRESAVDDNRGRDEAAIEDEEPVVYVFAGQGRRGADSLVSVRPRVTRIQPEEVVVEQRRRRYRTRTGRYALESEVQIFGAGRVDADSDKLWINQDDYEQLWREGRMRSCRNDGSETIRSRTAEDTISMPTAVNLRQGEEVDTTQFNQRARTVTVMTKIAQEEQQRREERAEDSSRSNEEQTVSEEDGLQDNDRKMAKTGAVSESDDLDDGEDWKSVVRSRVPSRRADKQRRHSGSTLEQEGRRSRRLDGGESSQKVAAAEDRRFPEEP
ncbi:hypothetical protein F441_22262 [Phytophthora nicotianae CJ01A1]|nr:hypothetical protein F441_22262 [Phytophthora nicotianae CJ01A1]